MVQEGRTLKTVSDSTSSFHTIRHARWAAREDANLWEQHIFLLEAVKELVKVGTTKVGYSPQTSEETAT